MKSVKAIFRIAALFLLVLAILPLILVHTRLAGLLIPSPAKEFNHLAVNAKTKVVIKPLTNDSTKEARPTNDLQGLREKLRNESLAVERENGKGNEVIHDDATSWFRGCHLLLPPERNEENYDKQPSGLVVVLSLAPGEAYMREYQRICHTIPNQIEYFLEPQGLDMLFLVQEEDLKWSMEKFISCWGLVAVQDEGPRTWKNLDGTILTATAYYGAGKRSKIFLARTEVQYPKYIQEDMSILLKPITPKSCQAPRKYIQATRWYTHEMLNLGILTQYDYFLKIDTDIQFLASIPFHILEDMSKQQAVFGHTAEYHPRGSKVCAQGIQHAVVNFTKSMQFRRLDLPNWKRSMCTLSPEVQRDTDQYYTNFIIGKVSFWQSQWVREFSNFLNEFPTGFFAYRWTDQIFWHYAMGLFLENFHEHVIDYTDLRCMPHPACWLSSYNFKRYGRDAWHRCENNGYFVHPKDYNIVNSRKEEPIQHLVWNKSQSLYQTSYRKDCST